MAETDDKKVLKMSLICSICLQKLNKPRSLPCFHTFCESCLKNYLVNAPEKKNATKEGIPCPTCKLVTFAPKPTLPVAEWAEHFPVNHLVGTLIDIVPVSSRLEFCEPCKDNKESKIARSWCQQCNEALCEECAKCHMSMKATKSHEITPLENVRSNPKPAVKEEIICTEHSKKEVDMYCVDHEQPCCPTCIATNHRNCQKVSQISEVLGQNQTDDSAQLFKDMDRLVLDADGIKRERQEVMRSTLAQKSKMLQDIADAKRKLLDHIEKIESQITAKFNAISQTDFAILQEQVEYCNSVQSAMHHSKTAIQSAKEQKLPQKTFIVTKQGRIKYKECSDGLKSIHKNAAKIQYLFEEDRQVAETLGALEMLGKLDVKHTYPNRKPATPPPPPTPTPPDDDEKKAARKVKTFNTKVKGDKRECKITSIKLWNNKKILLADHSNVRLKLFGEFGDLLSSFSCNQPPWDFTFIDKYKCAVTFPNERKIRIFKINENITETGYIPSTRGSSGICMAGDDLAVTYSSGCIRIISIDGVVKMMVDTDYVGKRVFSNPEYITFNAASSHLYVSDYNNHNITALEYDNGKVNKTPVFVYPVSGPRGVQIDTRGCLYVCGFWSNDIHKIKEKGKFRQILMDTLARPLFITFSGDGERFALSEQGNPNSVKIYKIVPANEIDE